MGDAGSTANRRSFRLGLPFALLFDLQNTDDAVRSGRRARKVAASWITMMSRGSPSSALVDAHGSPAVMEIGQSGEERFR